MEERAKRLIEQHRNPIKVEFPTSKNYLRVDSEKEDQDVAQGLLAFHTILERELVERRCVRLEGEWLKDRRLVKIIRNVGSSLKHFGFQDKTGQYLYPEEAMFLLESVSCKTMHRKTEIMGIHFSNRNFGTLYGPNYFQNRLEILWNKVTMSIQQAYSVLLAPTSSAEKYFVYKKLVAEGFKIVLPFKQCKRKFEQADTPRPKKLCSGRKEPEFCTGEASGIGKNQPEMSSGEPSAKDQYKEVFQKLKETAPKNWPNRTTMEPNYKAYSPDNKEVFNVFVCGTEEFDPRWGLLEENSANLFGFVQNDTVAFYRFGSVNIGEP